MVSLDTPPKNNTYFTAIIDYTYCIMHLYNFYIFFQIQIKKYLCKRALEKKTLNKIYMNISDRRNTRTYMSYMSIRTNAYISLHQFICDYF